MTEEELLAEEYICNGKCQDDITKNYVHCKTCKRIKDFLSGLKAGRPQWHDLRKDPKDVPDEGTYLVVWQNARGYRETMIMRYEEDDEEEMHWIDVEGDWWDDDVIAWREIPKFEEAAE